MNDEVKIDYFSCSKILLKLWVFEVDDVCRCIKDTNYPNCVRNHEIEYK